MSPCRGKRTGEDPSNHPSISTPGLAEVRGSKYTLCVSKIASFFNANKIASMVREVKCPLLKRDN
jgi:hypothetical protein